MKVRTYERKSLVRDVNVVLVGLMEEGFELCGFGHCDMWWKCKLGV